MFQALALHSDKGLMLEMPVLKSLYGGQITLSALLIKPNIRFHSPLTQHRSVFWN